MKRSIDTAAFEAWQRIDSIGWRSVALDVIALFVRTVPQLMASLRSEAEAGEVAAVASLARSLRSSFALVGAQTACDLSAQVESLAREARRDRLAGAVADLDAAYDEAMQELAEYEVELLHEAR